MGGGAGKTPFVRWAVQSLQRDGLRPIVAMRGYGARHGEAGDEELEYRERLPGVPPASTARRQRAELPHLPPVSASCGAGR